MKMKMDIMKVSNKKFIYIYWWGLDLLLKNC